jgi:hypothetical protein
MTDAIGIFCLAKLSPDQAINYNGLQLFFALS